MYQVETTEPRMNKGLSAYDKSCGGVATATIQGYNGDSAAAMLSMNALFDAVKKGRKSLSKREHYSRHLHYGVGVPELEPSAIIGVSLSKELGLEAGIQASYNVMLGLVKAGEKVTIENAQNLLGLVEAMESGK